MGGETEEKRHAILRLRSLVWEEAAQHCRYSVGDHLQKERLELAVMKVVRARWKQQPLQIQEQLLGGDDHGLTAAMLSPYVVPELAHLHAAPVAAAVAGEAAAAHAAAADVDGAAPAADADLEQVPLEKPKWADLDRGVKALVAKRRAELMPIIKAENGKRDNKWRETELRKRVRVEYVALSVREQWELVRGPHRSAAVRGSYQGMFIPSHDAETPVLNVEAVHAKAAFPGDAAAVDASSPQDQVACHDLKLLTFSPKWAFLVTRNSSRDPRLGTRSGSRYLRLVTRDCPRAPRPGIQF